MHDFTGTDRFTIVRRIGAGGMGIVYEAYDKERDVRVALKTLPKVDAAALYRFKHEFRALTDVVHPNLVALYQLISVGEQWFFTMEFVNGCDFLEYVRPQAVAASEGKTGLTSSLSTPQGETVDYLHSPKADKGIARTRACATRPSWGRNSTIACARRCGNWPTAFAPCTKPASCTGTSSPPTSW